MKAKYKVSLSLIGLMLVLSLSISIGYGVYVSTNNKDNKDSVLLDCFKVYFSNGQKVTLKNIDPILAEEANEITPNTLTITNVCDTEKELQVRLNTFKDTTLDTKALTINASGDLEQENILYKNLKSAKTNNDNVSKSKIIGKITVKPNETIRTNIKMWFDEKKLPNVTPEETYSGEFELIDTAASARYTFAETLLADGDITKTAPSFDEPSVTNEGLYQTTVNGKIVYYYRGVVNNNYVKFGNYIYRIVSISDNQGIKLVSEKSIGQTKYSKYSSTLDDAGLTYKYYGKKLNNNVVVYLYNWYKKEITGKGLSKYVLQSEFCNDSTSRKEIYKYYFGGYDRLVTKSEPTLTCPTTTADFGGIYQTRISLLTADEVVMAGGAYEENNHNYYLYNGERFYTITPSHFQANKMNLFAVNNNGALTTANTNTTLGVRPVINIDGTVLVSGNGTKNNPYIIES